MRLAILRSGSLIGANIGAMALLGGWLGTQFVSTLYMQQLRGWSAIEAGLAFFPGGLLIVVLTPRFSPRLVARFGLGPVIVAGLTATAAGYALLMRIGLDTDYPTVMLPAFVLIGIGNALAYGPLTVAATNGIAPEEQGLASGLVNTSFQFGGALVVAAVTAVTNAVVGPDGSPGELLEGYRAALFVPLIAAVIGVARHALPLALDDHDHQLTGDRHPGSPQPGPRVTTPGLHLSGEPARPRPRRHHRHPKASTRPARRSTSRGRIAASSTTPCIRGDAHISITPSKQPSTSRTEPPGSTTRPTAAPSTATSGRARAPSRSPCRKTRPSCD